MSNGQYLRSNHIRKIKRKYAYLRKRLQSCGTRSAKQKLKKLAGRERRFMHNFNHQISKHIVSLPYAAFALEDLKDIRKNKKGKKFNRMMSNWAYYQFRKMLEYKAEEQGKLVILVDPKYTSQRCCNCSYIAKTNRNKGKFRCGRCQFYLPADLNASINISQRGQPSYLSRLSSINQ
jgi:putative transposase